jgi:uncharacterized protein (TIGR03437 family)
VVAPVSQAAMAFSARQAGAGNVAAAWIGLQAVGGSVSVQGVFVSCAAAPEPFADTRMLTGVTGAVRHLAMDADAAGGLHMAFVQVLDRDSKVLYLQGRCPAVLAAEGAGNAYSRQPGVVAGSLVALTGSDLGPGETVTAKADEKGFLPVSLEGVEVRIDGIAAPVVSARRDSIVAQAPWEIAGKESVKIAVKAYGFESGEITAAVRTSAPGLLTVDGSGRGAAAAANEDGERNTEAKPAGKGRVVTLTLTGHGGLQPAPRTGEAVPEGAPYPLPAMAVEVLIDGKPAELVSAEAAPGSVGTLTVKARVPADAGSGPVTVAVTVGGNASAEGTTLFVE